MTAAGGSLEDCHTNVFVLTELNGLKWKCLTTVQNYGHTTETIEDDPVLRAYGECLSKALLCTWRRKPRSNGTSDTIFDDPAPSIESQKELWVFWYSQDEPKCIETFCSNGLIVADDYESFDVGVNYETRVLFFKALHNIIERNLLRSGYIRFGKWFTRPLDMPIVDFERSLPQYINAINFRFFMHGENHVCVTINVQRQPTMLRLSSCHFETNKCQPVILGPWSIRAVLLPNQPLMNNTERAPANGKNSQKACEYFSMFPGNNYNKTKSSNESNGFAEIQAAVTQQWNDWKKFQALPFDEDEEISGSDTSDAGTLSTLPKMVLVEVDGVRMFYPSCYVGILADQMVFDGKNCRLINASDNSQNLTVGATASSNCRNSTAPSDLDLSFGENSESRLNNAGASGSEFCAEDHEVEEILNSHMSSGPGGCRLSPSSSKGNSFMNGSAHSALRHCKRSFAGIRTARRSFENGALSVLLSTNCISRRFDVLSGDSMLIGSGNPDFINGGTQVEEDTRWNFFDYLRREYCYCKMCSNNNPSTSVDDNASNQLFSDVSKGSYAFHRSPTVLESVTPDHSPTFVDELRALRMTTSTECDGLSSASSSTSETEMIRSMWSNGVSARPDLISGRLEVGNTISSDDSDILKILPHNRHLYSANTSVPPRLITPFTPITAITPEPESASDGEVDGFSGFSKKSDGSLQQKIKDFDYLYNPLKRDILPVKSYHILDIRKKPIPIGPPTKNIFLMKSSLNNFSASNSGNNGSSLLNLSAPSFSKSKGQTSILKSLLDDGPVSPLPVNNECVVAMTSGCDSSNSLLDGFAQFTVGFGASSRKLFVEDRKHAKRRKFELAKTVAKTKQNIELPMVGNLDAALAAIEFEEPFLTLKLDSYGADGEQSSDENYFLTKFSDEFGDNSVLRYGLEDGEKMNQALASVFRSDQFSFIQSGQQQQIVKDIAENMSVEGSSAAEDAATTVASDAMDTSDAVTDAMTAVTPPALLSQSDDYTADQNENQEDESMRTNNANNMTSNGKKSPNSNMNRHFVTFGDATNANFPASSSSMNHIVSSVASDQMHILSPPASNERVEYSNGLSTASTSIVMGGNVSSLQPQTLLSALTGAASIMHDSLSIIYPTPPTPMQQFSPQNIALSVAQYSSADHHHQLQHTLTEPALLSNPSVSPPVVADFLRQAKSTVGYLFEDSQKHGFPESESFSGNLLDESVDIDQKLQASSISSSSSGYFTSGYASASGSGRCSEQREHLRTSLEARYTRESIDLPPAYKKAPREKSKFSNSIAIDTDRRLVLSLEKSEMALCAAAHGRQNFMGYPMFSVNNHNFMGPASQGLMNYGQFPGQIMNSPQINQYGGMHPGGFPIGMGNNQMMAGRPGLLPQNFRSLGPLMLQQQQFMQQQQMLNNQMMGGGMQKPMSPQQSPNYGNNSMQTQMFQQQFSNKRGQQSPLMDQTNSAGVFGKNVISSGLHPLPGMLVRQQSSNQFPLPSMCSNNSGVFQASTPQSHQIMNRFGSPPQMMNLQQPPLLPIVNANSSNFNRSNSMIGSDSNYAMPFSSPPGSVKMQHLQRASSSNSSCSLALSMGAVGGLMNGAAPNPMDYQLSSGLAIKATATTTLSTFRRAFGLMNLDEIIKLIQNSRSYVIAILMQDTVLDLHFDSVFDACPICCCNTNIRTCELGFYLKASDDVARCDEIQRKQKMKSHFMPDHWSGFRVSTAEIQSKCNCGFSAVRHRYLCAGLSGLFPDDSIEACGFRPVREKSSIAVNRLLWFNPALTADLQFLDLLRLQSLTRDFCSLIRNSYYLGNFPDSLDKCKKIGSDVTEQTDYIVSRVDSVEVDKIMVSAIGSAISSSKSLSEIHRPSKVHQRPVHHPWGVQIANGVREPKDSEYIAVIREIQPILDDSMKEARGFRNQSFANTKKLEGPLTWRSFLLKTSKAHTQQQEDEICQVEPIPNIIVATEREPVTTNPQLVSMWEKLSLAPFDQTKDVLYLAVVPDSNVVVEKCRIFLEELSSVYEKCRFGWHVRAHAKDSPRDGIIRLNHRSSANSNNSTLNFLSNFENLYVADRKVMMSRLRGFTENFENELLQFFKNNDALFERRAFHDSVYRHNMHQNFTSLATSSDTSSMPPPAIPIQSPSSVLSSASGPSSANAALSSGALMQMAQSISPSQNVQQQTSPVTGPNSAPSASNLGLSGGSSLEELTSEGHLVCQSNTTQQLQQQQPQNQASVEAEIEKNVEEMLSIENPSYLPHVVVIYVVNPFSFGSDAHHPILARVATVAILRAYNSCLYQLNFKRRAQVQLEIVNLQSLYDYTSFVADPLREDRQTIELVEMSNRDKMSARDCLRKIAFTVYSQPRLMLPEQTRSSMAKSMTRFGPSSAFNDILDHLKQSSVRKLFKVPSSPFILAPTKSIGVFTSKDGAIINPANSTSSNSKLQVVSVEERILFVTYCLIDDEWLCAAVTDEQGHLLDNVLINLIAVQPIVPNQQSENYTWKYAKHSQIFDSIQRLWQYIQSVLVMDSRNWRLVIGRVGKIGHGEFKAWTETLSKRNLRAYNNSLKNGIKQENGALNACKTCTQIPGYQEMPAILSACLVSTEPELHLRIFPSSIQSEGNSNLFTASVSSSSGMTGMFSSSSKNTKSKSPQGSSVAAALAVADDPSITHIMVFPTILNISFEQQLGQSNQEENDFDNYFCNDHKMEDDDQLHTLMNSMIGDDFDLNTDLTKNDEDTTIDNQPMATGYYISTAPALDLPDWFWSACPSARRRSPVHLKNSLHIHTGNIQQSDEISAIGNKSGGGGAIDSHHPLDSTATDEVLKYVLEKYNALSWINVDFATGARQSCLPVHVQALLRLQKSLTTLFS